MIQNLCSFLELSPGPVHFSLTGIPIAWPTMAVRFGRYLLKQYTLEDSLGAQGMGEDRKELGLEEIMQSISYSLGGTTTALSQPELCDHGAPEPEAQT